MNYGFAPLCVEEANLQLEEGDERNRLFIQLYHHVVGEGGLDGKRVLEVGCGRGGGSAYLARYFEPKILVGLDYALNNLKCCAQFHRDVHNLSWACGDAEALPFRDSSFHVVVNVESSHSYPDMGRFVAEVYRVLQPGGYFLFADFRSRGGMALLRELFRSKSFCVKRACHITESVLTAMNLDDERKRALINKKLPALLRDVGNAFAGIKGSKIYNDFRSGRAEYVSFVLEKV